MMIPGGGDDSSEESVNDEEEEEDEENPTTTTTGVNHNGHHSSGGGVRLHPPTPVTGPNSINPSSNHYLSSSNNVNSHHHHNHHQHTNNSSGNINSNNTTHMNQNQQPVIQHRKSYPPSPAPTGGGGAPAKVFRAAPVWKSGDEMIGVPVPRKARSASTKRLHEWMANGGGGATAGGGAEHSPQLAQTSPARGSLVSTSSPSPAAPLSPSSSNASLRKKMKPNGPKQPRPPKSAATSKASSSNPEELEIEIAEVLYGLKTQSQAPPQKKEEVNRSSSPSILPPNPISASGPLSAVAPKRKRPRQVSENPGNYSVRSSPISAANAKFDSDQGSKPEILPPHLEKMEKITGFAAESGFGVSNLPAPEVPLPEAAVKAADSEMKAAGEELGESKDVVPKEEGFSSPKKKESQSPAPVKAEETSNPEDAASGSSVVAEVSNLREEKFQIDLEAPPPQSRSSPERDGETSLSINHKPSLADLDAEMKSKQDEKIVKSVQESGIKTGGGVEQKPKSEDFESLKKVENRGRGGIIDLQLDLEKPERENGHGNKFQPAHKPAQAPSPSPAPLKLSKEDSHSEKPGQPSSLPLPLPMSMANWPGGLPPMGYMAPIQGVVSMDGTSVSQPPIQPYFSQPRPKRCATHCYIARNIDCIQQLIKMNPFWPAAAAANPASLFGSKPCNLSVAPPSELQWNVAERNASNVQDKGPQLAMFPGQTAKDNKAPQPVTNVADSNQRKQQILLQPALPPVAPNSILHGPAFIFPINHQQAAVAAASGKSPPATTATTGAVVSGNTSNPATVGGGISAAPAGAGTGPGPALSFNYPNMSANETQYLAILQNNGYPFPLPAVGAPPPNFRGTHPQAMPLFNGSFYSSQIIHPSQLQQQTPPQQQQHHLHHQQGPPVSQSQSQQPMQQQANQNASLSSGSSSSQKHLQNQQQQQQQQQRSAGNSAGVPTVIGCLQNFQAPKNRPSQQQLQQQHMALLQQSRQHENDAGNEDSPSTADSRVSRPPVNLYGPSFTMPMHHQNFAMLSTPGAVAGASATSGNSNQSDKKQQQQQQAHARQMGLKNVVESLPAQAFAMSFASLNGATGASGIDLSSMPQNQAILQSLPESTRQNIQMMAAANAAQQQRKSFRISEESKTGGTDSSNTDEERKAGKSSTSAGGQSIAFSRSELTDGSGSAPLSSTVIDSSARSLNLSSGPAKNSRPGISGGNVGIPSAQQQAQHQQQQQQQQQMLQQMHKHQQQYAAASAAWNKNSSAPNGTTYAEHLSSTSSPVNAKFPNSHAGFPQNLVPNSNNSSSPTQSPQWKNPSRNTPPLQVSSSFATSSGASSLKSLPQQQQHGRNQQNHSQISFGVNQNQKVSSSVSPAQQQPPSSHNQSPASPMMVGSPSNSSMSKGAGGSPRTNTSATASSKTGQASSLSGNQGKNSPVPGQRSSPVGGRIVPSILGNPHIAVSSSSSSKPQMQTLQQQQQQQQLQMHQQQQQQIAKNFQQQAQLYFSSPYMQAQPPITSSTNSTPSAPGAAGYYVQRRRPDQQQLGQPQTSNGMLSVSLAGGTSTSDPAKALAAASNMNLKGGGFTSQNILQAAQFSSQSSGNQHQMMPAGFAYVQAVPAAVPVKSSEQKQPASNDNLHACWQPEKK